MGLPHALAFGQAGFPVLGLDLNASRVDATNQGISEIPDVPSSQLAALVEAGRLSATAEYSRLSEADVILICVPTPFDDMKTPDLNYIVAASQGIVAHLRPRMMVILQSTTYPGTTEEIVQPLLETSGLKAGQAP